MLAKFKKDNDLEMRKKTFKELIDAYPNKLPIICEKNPRSKKLNDIAKTKYLVNADFMLYDFYEMIRQKLALKKEEAMFLLVNIDSKRTNSLQVSTEIKMKSIYEQYKDEDGFLYVFYEGEEVWG